jgi:hypothetical protein
MPALCRSIATRFARFWFSMDAPVKPEHDGFFLDFESVPKNGGKPQKDAPDEPEHDGFRSIRGRESVDQMSRRCRLNVDQMSIRCRSTVDAMSIRCAARRYAAVVIWRA